MNEKLYGYTAYEWMMAALEFMDGNFAWHEIMDKTGLPEDRCKELAAMFAAATKDGWPRRAALGQGEGE